MTLSYFQELADYNIWANNMVRGWLESISEDQWSQPITSSFGSIGATALHIAGAERIWYDRLAGIENPIWLPNEFKGSKKETLDVWEECSTNLKTFLMTFDPQNMTSILSFKRLNGEPYEILHYHVFAHVFNHSTYHRGQIITMLKQVGLDQMSGTDMLVFFRKI